MSTGSTPDAARGPARPGVSLGVKVAVVVALAIAALGVIFTLNNSSGPAAGGGKYPFAVGNPGPGKAAPPIQLPSTAGTFDLAALRGQNVLLFFQEGVMCQPCWDQIRDIEKNWSQFQALGVDRLVSVTTDELGVLEQKVRAEGIGTPIVSDPSLSVSRSYEANLYGMMGNTMNGHSFVLVDGQGTIRWRADYGGAPKYTMYVPVPDLLADLKRAVGANGLAAKGGS